ncbi:MAG: HEAT repeat domain-containing protein [Byssovorax sp.]
MFRAPSLPRTLAAALRDLAADKPAVRASAIRDLVPHAEGARDDVIAALERALEDREASVRATAATALADVNAVESIRALLDAITDPDKDTRAAVISALGELGDPAAAGPVRAALGDDRPEVRFQATIAYPRVAPTRRDAVEALLQATRDDDAFVCQIALRMAEEVAGDDRNALDERVFVRARAMVNHGAPGVRVSAAVFLARASADRVDRAVREVLVAVALGEIEAADGEDAAAAIELAGELGLADARPGLARRAFGGLFIRRDQLAWHARVALARMGDERAIREILRELGSWDRDRRTLAVAAAGRARLREARPLIASMRGDEGRADPNAVDEALASIAEAGAT